MEKVLVLMATYNGEKYLQEQLDSLYKQQGVEIEILVRDDGSTDSTTKILEENSIAHNLVWYQGEHKNVSKGFYELMKKGARQKCDFFAFCDQDDVWDFNKLIIAVNKIRNIKGPALYYSGQRLVDENLSFIENHKLNKNRSLKTRFILSDFAGCTGVFNKLLIDEIIKYEPNYMLNKKGVLFLLDIIEVLDRNLNFIVDIYGDGEQKREIENTIVKKKLQDVINIKGNVQYSKISDAYSSADIFVLPSLRESGGSVLVEAMAHGLPIVALDMAFATILKERKCGLFVDTSQEKENIIKEMAFSLEKLILDENLRTYYGTNGFNYVNNELNWEKMIKKVYGQWL